MAILDVVREIRSMPLASQFHAIRKEAGLSPMKAAIASARLGLGRGKVSFQDYVKLRLFDPALPRDRAALPCKMPG